MTEIPESLRRRAEDAKRRAEAKARQMDVDRQLEAADRADFNRLNGITAVDAALEYVAAGCPTERGLAAGVDAARVLAVAVEELRAIVAIFAQDDDPCWFDHHGDCQAHGWFGLADDALGCPVARARAAVGFERIESRA